MSPEERPTVLREDDKSALWKATARTGFAKRRDRVILRLFLDSGMRLGEIGGLRLEAGLDGLHRTCSATVELSSVCCRRD